MREKVITRRDFLRGSVAATLAATMGLPLKIKGDVKATKKTKVVLIRDADVIDRRGRINPKVIQRMLDKAVTTLLGKEDPVEAWKLLIRPKDIVGIKSNVWGPLPTPKELEDALKGRIMDAGVHEGNIAIDDRGVLKNRIFLNSTTLINVRPLRTHHWAGVGGCIKNYIMFTLWPPLYHPDSCADLGAIWRLPLVKDKTRLNVLILLTPLFHGIGPHHFDPTYTWPYKGILVGTDPVAVDAVGLRIFELKRLAYFGENIPLRPPAKHIAIADVIHKVGTSELRQIELVKPGWMEEVLI
ncbi:MAG: DUF362 domain-containing protein [Nitrospirae bacterium]|nr:DUF362 domain-containing protein [Nitrospirota bacterium]